MYRAALALGTANQLTNILRDVGEDIRDRNRIYVPLEELKQYGMTEQEVSSTSGTARTHDLLFCSVLWSGVGGVDGYGGRLEQDGGVRAGTQSEQEQHAGRQSAGWVRARA